MSTHHENKTCFYMIGLQVNEVSTGSVIKNSTLCLVLFLQLVRFNQQILTKLEPNLKSMAQLIAI